MRWRRGLSFVLVMLLLACAAAAGPVAPRGPASADTPRPVPLDVAAPATATDWLTELIPGMDYGAWFTDHTGNGLSDHFAAYAVAPLEGTLYVGFGAARPGENDGSLLASSDGITITAVYTPTEQGFIDMDVVGDTLFFPGPDPTDVVAKPANQWDWGNFYVYTPPAAVIKHRNLPDVIHAWGEWFDPATDTLYTVVGAHLGDYKTWTGGVFSSIDAGASWTQLANRDQGVGQYRTYDIIGFHGRLYVIWNDVYGDPCGLAVRSDGGTTWSRIPELDLQTVCRTRLVVYQDRLLIPRVDGAALFAVDAAGTVTTHALPGLRIADWAYNYLAEDGAGRLYAVADDGRIVRTADLATWETLVSRDLLFITLGYWPDRDWLLVGDRGWDARLWKIDLAASSAITIPQAPAVTITRNGDTAHLDWPDVTLDVAGKLTDVSGYLVYRSTDPYFKSHVSNRIAAPAASELTDADIGGANVIGDVAVNYFYLVRTVDAGGVLSANGDRVGEFDFALVPGE